MPATLNPSEIPPASALRSWDAIVPDNLRNSANPQPHKLKRKRCRCGAVVMLAIVLLGAPGAPAQDTRDADPLADIKRREVLNQSAPKPAADVERYALVVLLPMGMVLLGLLLWRGSGR